MNTHRGFTLVETIVVIGIVLLLAGIVYAVMGPARERARQLRCVSNLRQIGHAMRLYVDDYDGSEVVEGEALDYWQLGLPGPPHHWAFRRDYLKNRDLLFCPSYHGPEPIGSVSSTYWWPVGDVPETPPALRFREIVRRRGGDTPITVCTSHNAVWNEAAEPRWAIKKVLALRLDGRVNSRMVGVRTHTADW